MPTLLASAPAAAWDPPIPILPPIYIPPVKATVWAYAPTAPEYRLNGGYTNNNYGDVVIRRTSVGSYTITLENAGSTIGGVAHVVAYGSNPVFCTVADSYPVINSTVRNHIIKVRCFNATGAPIDSPFVATYTNTRHIQQGRLLYFTTDQERPSGVRAIPSNMGYDTTGAPIHYQRLSTGRYLLHYGAYPPADLPVPAVMGHLTAVNSAAVHCQEVLTDRWEVWCSNASGQMVDSRFAVTVGLKVDPLGNSVGTRFSTSRALTRDIGSDGRTMWVPSYNTAVAGEWHGVAGTVIGAGRYRFVIDNMATPYGTAFVSSERYSSPRGFCVVGGWGRSGSNEVVHVNCYQYGGMPANLDITLSFTTWSAT